jgi:sterol desaturase/sphingolipid hydroxylase (fatty acid hydroxylase superfamily)
MGLEIFGLAESQFRLGSFIGIFVIMAILETWLPRRKRRHSRARRWTTNFAILASDFATVSLVTIIVPVTAVIAAFWATERGWGLFNVVDLPFWLEALIAFVALDLLIWTQHLITHKIPILWRFHRVHHADHDLDASSGFRFHPLEIVFSIFVKAIFVVALGPAAIVVVVFEAAVNASAVFNHANLKLPLGLDRILRPLIVTPDMHRVHHSDIRRETDSNYGFFLSVWDRLFGVYRDQPEKGHDGMTVGLRDHQQSGPEKIGWSLLFPFRK